MIKGEYNDISDLTIAKYNELNSIMGDEDPFALFKFFGIDIDKLSIGEMNSLSPKLTNLKCDKLQVKKHYMIGGTKFKLLYNLTKLKAGQFIEFQSYMSGDKNMEDILSVFLIPMKKKFGIWVEQKYGEYDTGIAKKLILNNLTIAEANALSSFFLTLSTRSLKLLMDSLTAEKTKMEKKMSQTDKSKQKTLD